MATLQSGENIIDINTFPCSSEAEQDPVKIEVEISKFSEGAIKSRFKYPWVLHEMHFNQGAL